jgi:type IV pilus assembly protein PilV
MERGFSLIEVLVSLCVLSIGILSAAGMQLTALRTTQESGFHATAVQLASEIAEQIRMQGARGKFEDAMQIYLSVDYTAETAPVQPSNLCFGLQAQCDANDLARFNVYELERRIKDTLPLGRVIICRDSEPWDAGAARYKWSCSGADSTTNPIVVKIGWKEKNTVENSIQDKNPKPVVALMVGL